MGNKKQKERSALLLLIVAILLMTVGFAAYATTLNINGTVNVKGTPWNVHYVIGDSAITETGVTPTSKSIDNTNFAFEVTLEKPGDYYEASFNVINEGSINAKLTKVTMNPITAHSKYLKYTVFYNGTEYAATTSGLEIPLTAGAQAPVKVKVEYLKPESQNDLPQGDEMEVSISGNLLFEDVL